MLFASADERYHQHKLLHVLAGQLYCFLILLGKIHRSVVTLTMDEPPGKVGWSLSRCTLAFLNFYTYSCRYLLDLLPARALSVIYL